MERLIRIIKRLFLILGALLLLVVLAVGIFSAFSNWQGVCEPTSGVQVPCSRVEFMLREMFWGIFLFIPYLFLATLVYLGMSLAQFITSLAQKRRQRE
jgi:hypothetical protein